MIEFNDVTKVYSDGTTAVDGVSFTVPKGEILTLVGPSGCGKTTTMKMINALITPTSGEVIVDGMLVEEIDPIDLRRNIGYVIQDIGLFEHYTIEENVGVVPDILGWDQSRIERRVDELLELVQLPPEMKGRYPAELSGGQRQRVGVARALAASPNIVLMDEPFGALDPITRSELQNELLDICSTIDVTVIFVTHDLDEALKMGTRVAVMRDGEIAQHGTPAQLLSDPVPFVDEFLGEDRVLKQLGVVTVEEVMQPANNEEVRDGPTLSPDDTLRAALQALLAVNGSSLPVVSDGTRVGTLHEDDIRATVGKDIDAVLEEP